MNRVTEASASIHSAEDWGQRDGDLIFLVVGLADHAAVELLGETDEERLVLDLLPGRFPAGITASENSRLPMVRRPT